MKTTIVLVMHGVPPNDFPKQELAEFFTLHGRLRRERGEDNAPLVDRYNFLNDKIKNWPRTPANDPFHSASQDLAANLKKATGCDVVVGYNEFCAPGVVDALEQAVEQKTEKIIAVTPMMTRGGEHTEVEIPALLQHFQKVNTGIEIVYAWPFDTARVAQFLAQHISQFA